MPRLKDSLSVFQILISYTNVNNFLTLIFVVVIALHSSSEHYVANYTHIAMYIGYFNSEYFVPTDQCYWNSTIITIHFHFTGARQKTKCVYRINCLILLFILQWLGLSQAAKWFSNVLWWILPSYQNCPLKPCKWNGESMVNEQHTLAYIITIRCKFFIFIW